MRVLNLIACMGMIAGAFLLLAISPTALADGIFAGLLARPDSLRSQRRKQAGKRKDGYLIRELKQAQTTLTLTGRADQFAGFCTCALLLFAVGAGVALLLGNYYLLPVLATGCMLLPFWYLRLSQSAYKRNLSAELETALSIITTSYLRSDNFLLAVEENLRHLLPPVQAAFQAFHDRVRYLDPNMEHGLLQLKDSVQNPVFQEWVDAVLTCQADRTLKSTLTPIVGKLSDMRVVNGELDNIVFAPRKEFLSMVALVLSNLPLLYFLNRDWYGILMYIANQLIKAYIRNEKTKLRNQREK